MLRLRSLLHRVTAAFVGHRVLPLVELARWGFAHADDFLKRATVEFYERLRPALMVALPLHRQAAPARPAASPPPRESPRPRLAQVVSALAVVVPVYHAALRHALHLFAVCRRLAVPLKQARPPRPSPAWPRRVTLGVARIGLVCGGLGRGGAPLRRAERAARRAGGGGGGGQGLGRHFCPRFLGRARAMALPISGVQGSAARCAGGDGGDELGEGGAQARLARRAGRDQGSAAVHSPVVGGGASRDRQGFGERWTAEAAAIQMGVSPAEAARRGGQAGLSLHVGRRPRALAAVVA